MTISNTDNVKAPDLKFDNLTFKQSSGIKYLGVVLDCQLNFKPHTKKINKNFLRLLITLRENCNFLSTKLAALWYVWLIRSNLEYCAPPLFPANDYIEKEFLKIENRCLKIIDFGNSKARTSRTINLPKLTLGIAYLYWLSFYKLVNNLVPIINKWL